MQIREVALSLTLCILLGLLTGVLLFQTKKTSDITEELRKSYSSVCLVKSGPFRGSGVLLDTGYILTAAHTFDWNRNGSISSQERHCKVAFGDGTDDEHEARVVYFDFLLDFAILEPHSANLHMRDAVSISIVAPKLADPIYTIGCTNAQPPMLSEGRISYSIGSAGRASCFVYSGNSGGPLFNTFNDVIGVVVAMGFSPKRDRVVVPIPSEDGMQMSIGSVTRIEPISGICFYTKVEDIYFQLAVRNIDVLVKKKPEKTLYEKLRHPYIIGAANTTVQVGLFLAFVFFIRRHLFGPSMR